MTDTIMLYRPREAINPEAWNLPLDTLIVEVGDIEAAFSEGWLHAENAIAAIDRGVAAEPVGPGPYDSLLDAPVKDIVPLLAEMTAIELEGLHRAEKAGKARAGLLADIDKAIEAKGA